jgi:glutaminyl-tRNA synthetase
MKIYCSYIPESRSGNDTSGVKVKGTIHWLSIPHAATAQVRLYDRLFKVEDPDGEEGNFKDYINSDSLHVVERAYIETALLDAKEDQHFQFIRKGYFCLDKDSTNGKLVFNRTVSLKDTWAKQQE